MKYPAAARYFPLRFLQGATTTGLIRMGRNVRRWMSCIPGTRDCNPKTSFRRPTHWRRTCWPTRRLNASKTQWTLVVTNVENQSHDPGYNADIFTERLKVKLSQYGQGRVALIENKAKLENLQHQELEPGQRQDNYGQGPGTPAGPNGIQPDYALYGKIMEMPNHSTTYYFCEFSITDLHSRRLVWTRSYEVSSCA